MARIKSLLDTRDGIIYKVGGKHRGNLIAHINREDEKYLIVFQYGSMKSLIEHYCIPNPTPQMRHIRATTMQRVMDKWDKVIESVQALEIIEYKGAVINKQRFLKFLAQERAHSKKTFMPADDDK